ncbi:MAG: hypothetical protein PF961_01445 [Planctomycetota bacterium]|nr:hypothetical protein [Planctomycetota bacterium]
MSNVLLLCGPTGFEAADDRSHLWAGTGLYAAASAAAFAPCQLWARAGDALTESAAEMLERNRIDPAGLGAEGPSPRFGGDTPAQGPFLPEVEPVNAEQLGAAAIIDLAPTEAARASRVIAALPESGSRPVLIMPPADTDGDSLRAQAAQATVLVVGAQQAAAALGIAEPLACAEALLEAGATAVLVTAGAFGGIMAYKGKRTAWPCLPSPSLATSGHARAVFAGAMAGQLAQLGRIDFRNGKRFVATASAVAGAFARKPGPKQLMQLDHAAAQGQFLQMRRNAKY